MARRRHSFGKFVIGAAAVGAAAYGVYKVLERRRQILEEDEADFEEGTASVDETAEQERAGGTESGGEPLADELDFEADETVSAEEDPADSEIEENDSRYASVNFRQAADRAYTTIQHGSQEAMQKVKEAVGPKGAEVIDTVGEAAGEVGRTVAASASKIIDILAQPEEPVSAADAAVETESPEEIPGEEPSAKGPSAETAEEPAITEEDTAEEESTVTETESVQPQAEGTEELPEEEDGTEKPEIPEDAEPAESETKPVGTEQVVSDPDPVESFFDEEEESAQPDGTASAEA